MIPKNKIEEASKKYYISNYCKVEETDSIGELNRIFTGGVEFAEKELENLPIEFAEWILNNPLNFQSASKQRFIGLNMKYYTAEELFEIFKKEKYEHEH